MNILVLSDNAEVLARAKPIFEKRKVSRWTFTDSDAINPKKDFKHIIDNYDLVFSLHCKKIFPKVLTDGVRCINIHPGFNPYNRGIFPHVFSIVNGLPTGVTIHEMTDEVDLGPCIYQYPVDINKNDTSGSLYNRIINLELKIIDDILDYIIDENMYLMDIRNKAYVSNGYQEQGNYNSLEDFKRLCEFKPHEVDNFQNFWNRLRALSHAGYLNAHMNGIKFKLIIEHGNENPT